MEILAVIIFLIYLFFLAYLFKGAKIKTIFSKIPKIVYLFTILALLAIIIHLSCPGNNQRFIIETSHWLGEYYL